MDNTDLLTTLKLEMMRDLDAAIRRRYSSQQAAADAMGIERNRLSHLRSGHMERFSIPGLILMAEKIRAHVRIIVE